MAGVVPSTAPPKWLRHRNLFSNEFNKSLSKCIGSTTGRVKWTSTFGFHGIPVTVRCCGTSLKNPQRKGFSLKNCALCIALAATIATLRPSVASASSFQSGPVIPELSVLISGPPIKDPKALLRYALPVDNKAIREVQKTLEDITENLKIPGVKALDSVERWLRNALSGCSRLSSLDGNIIGSQAIRKFMLFIVDHIFMAYPSVLWGYWCNPTMFSKSLFTKRNVRQAARIFNQSKPAILAGIAESKKDHGQELLDKITAGLQDFQKIVEARERDFVVPKQQELLDLVGSVEEDMVDGFPFEVPEEYSSKPLLKGRATVEMKVKVKDNPNLQDVIFRLVLDGYNAPVTAGNFADLVERHFYDGMEIQRADGFVVQTGDPEGPAEGFVDPSTEKVRKIPLEIMVGGDKSPIYGATLEELGRYKARTKLPFNAFGTMAMARDEFDDDSASSQIFWLLKESELTPSDANILDGRYAVFGYVTENQDYLADLKVGDVIESAQVVSGIDNLVNPSYKIAV